MFPLALEYNRVGHEGAPCTISMRNHGSFCAEICYGQGALDLPYHIRAQVRGVVSVADNAVSRVPTSGMEVRSMSGGPWAMMLVADLSCQSAYHLQGV